MERQRKRQGKKGGREDFDPSELSEAMMDWAIVFAGAALVGIGLHLALRAAGLRWSWALPIFALAPALALLSLQAGLAAAVASGSAVAIGLAWHRAELERGGEEAQRGRDRPGPLSLVSRREVAKAKHERIQSDRFALGETTGRRIRTIPFGSRQGVRGLIVGAPGAGKTVTMAAIAAAYVSSNLPLFCIDPKGDPSLRAMLEAAAAVRGARFRAWSPGGPSVYNPLARGSATEIADKALAGEEWSEPHYLRQAQRYLGWEVRAIQAAGEEVSLASVSRFLDPGCLEALGDRCRDDLAGDLRVYLAGLSERQRADLGGARDRLAVLAESELGVWLGSGQGEPIELGASWREREIVYFRLDADRYPLASEMLGAAIVSDLVALTGELQGAASLGLIAIDEFSAIGARNVLRVLSRSRSAGISVVLATQALADLEDVASEGSPEGFARRVMSQLDFAICHRQPEPTTAEVLAGLAGTKPVWVTTRRVESPMAAFSGQAKESVGTRTREREFIRHPDEFKRLRTGEAIVIEPASGRQAERVRVWPVEHGASVPSLPESR
jgi:TraM recognition site of TraD and TraG/Bacterial protein of unknown function (DUF853)